MKTEKVTIKQKKIMIHNISRYLLTLVALLAMTTGAWAEETATITLKCGSTVKTYEDATLPWSSTADILKEVISDLNFNVNINAISGGDGKVEKYGNENFKVTGTFSGEATVTVTYNTGSSATITVTAPAPAAGTVTLNEAKTEATMEMPASDVTLEYELVRDLTVAVDLNLLIDQQPVTRARIARVGNGPYQLQGNWQFAAIDKLDAQNPVSLTNGELVYTLKKKDGDGYVAVNTETDLAPGLWRLEATANEGKPYDGTIYSADIELYAVYDLYLSPAQDENVSVTANDKAVSPDAEGKISEVESGKTVKLNVTNADYIIRKATVKVKGAAEPTTLTITGAFTATIYYIPGETWKQAIENHPTENTGWVIVGTVVGYQDTKHWVYSAAPDKVIDPNANYTAQYDPYDD